METCLVMGGTGLIGSHLIQALSCDYEVYVLSRSFDRDDSNHQIHFIHGDLRSLNWMDVLPEKVDFVIHLAQSQHYKAFPDEMEDIVDINIQSLLQSLDYARKVQVKAFVYASSGGIYGFGDTPFREDAPLYLRDDLGFYLSGKMCAEILAQNYSAFMPVMALRFFFVYGKGQRRQMFLPRIVDNVLEERPIFLDGEMGMSCNPIHVADAVRAIRQALLLRTSEVMNIAGPEVIALREMGEIIGRKTSALPLFDVKIDVKPKSLIADIDKMTRLLGAPTIRFEDGIHSLLPVSELVI